jgi:hypothetical protein
MRALGSSGDAYERSQATSIASDFVERMTAQLNFPDRHVPGNALYERNEMLAYYNNPSYWTPWGGTEARDVSCLSGSCTTAQMARFDINEARYYAGALLPGGQARLGTCPDQTANAADPSKDIACFYISWSDTTPTVGTGDNDCIDTNSNYATGSHCVVMRVY